MNVEEDLEAESKKRRVNLLVCVIDCNSFEWGALSNSKDKKSKFNFTIFIKYLLVFFKLFLFTSQNNRIVVIASTENPKNNKIIFPIPPSQVDEKSDTSTSKGKKRKRDGKSTISTDGYYESVEFSVIEKTIIDEFSKIGAKMNVNSNSHVHEKDEVSRNFIGNSIGHGLCYINSFKKRNFSKIVKSRMIVFQISPDSSKQYRFLMNCMFCAKNLSVVIDCCILSRMDSVWLQQVAKYTNGIYFKPEEDYREGLLQYLLQIYSVDNSLRNVIQLPDQDITELSVTSFDTKDKIDQGYICSECLAILSNKTFICPVCNSRFFSKNKKRKKNPKKKKNSVNQKKL